MTSLLPILPLLPLLLLTSASASTLAISSSSSSSAPTVCGVAEYNGTLLCAPLSSTTTTSTSVSSVAPFLSFAEVSAGRALTCGLKSGGAALFCWPPGDPTRLRRLYNGPDALADLAVGADHVAAYDAAARRILWWRRAGRFPEFVAGGFRSLVSGDGFSCAVQTNDSAGAVRCWGPRGTQVQSAFAPASSPSANASSYSYLAAGGTRACAVDDATGAVRCSGGGSAGSTLPERLFPYGLAVGDSHACGLLRRDRTAVCWSLGGPTTTVYYPAVGTQFQLLVADGNSTCGVTTADYSVLCWSSTSIDATSAPLTDIRPGACVADEAACGCGGFLPQSAQFCAGSGGVCDRLCADASPPPVSPPPPSSPPASPSSSGSKVSKRWIAFVVVGAVGSFAGLCSIVYCLVFGFCSNKRVHNSVQPNLTTTTTTTTNNNNNGAAENNNNNNNGGGGGPSPYGSPNGSRARALFRRQLSRVMTRQRSGPSSFKDPAEEFSLAQLDAATKSFALETKIGEGSFGTVYRGKLPDGREVAIKRGGASSAASPRRRRSYQEKESAFRSELAFLSRLHHKHLVGLVGYCDEDDERMLVYEYMKNGALFDHLHPKAPASSSSPSPVMSSWKLRIKILLDASRGIEYLHSYAVPPIIHRDIKSSNILLDAGWTARVSDFGLSLMGPSSEEEPPLQSHSQGGGGGGMLVKAAGTVGYMDPEYYGLHHLTTKSDVYGFGVVMLETLTGKRAIFRDDDESSPVVSSVVDHAVPAIVAGELARVLDPRAPAPAQPNEAEAVELVAYTAVHCVRLEGKDRPAMADIVANLETAFALCEGSDRGGGGGGFGNSSSSASLSVTSMDRSGAL